MSAYLGEAASVDLGNAARCHWVLLKPVKHDADGLRKGCLHSMFCELEGVGGSRGVQCFQSCRQIPAGIGTANLSRRWCSEEIP